MPSDGPSRDPRARLPAAIAARGQPMTRRRARGDPRRRRGGVLAGGRGDLPGRSGPARPGARGVARHGGRRSAASSPTPRIRPIRSPRPRPGGPRRSTARPRRPSGGVVRRGVPAAGRRERRRRDVARFDRVRLAGAARPRTTPTARRSSALAVARRPRRRSGAARLDRGRALRVVRADGPHRPADRARQRADGRPDPRARAGPGRPPGRRGVARHVRRRRLPGDQREGGHEAGDDVLRQVAAVLAESVRLVDTVGRIGGDEFVLVAPGLGRRDGRAAGPRRDRGTPRGRRPDRVGVGRRRPLPGRRRDSEALIAAATAALRWHRARAEASPRPGSPTRRRRSPVEPGPRRPPSRGRPAPTIGAVAPGPGSSVSARTMPSSVGSAVALEVGRSRSRRPGSRRARPGPRRRR